MARLCMRHSRFSSSLISDLISLIFFILGPQFLACAFSDLNSWLVHSRTSILVFNRPQDTENPPYRLIVFRFTAYCNILFDSPSLPLSIVLVICRSAACAGHLSVGGVDVSKIGGVDLFLWGLHVEVSVGKTGFVFDGHLGVPKSDRANPV